jgi:hypothetical protein
MILEEQIHLLYHACYSAYLREELRQGRVDRFPYPVDEAALRSLERTGLDRLDMIGENHVSQILRKWQDRLFPLSFAFLREELGWKELLAEYISFSKTTPVHDRLDVDISPNRFLQFMQSRKHREAALAEVFLHEFLSVNMAGFSKEMHHAQVDLDVGSLSDAVYIKTYRYPVHKIREVTACEPGDRPVHMLYLNRQGKALKAPLTPAIYQHFREVQGPLDPDAVYELLTGKK